MVDVFVDLLSGHTESAVADGQRLGIFVELDVNRQVAELALEVALLRQCLQLLRSIDSVGDHFTQENLMIGIQELFDDGENVLCCNPNITFFHGTLSY